MTQFYGDLDLGTNNRFGAVDSTTIIIGTISRSNSSKSSFRSSSLRTSLCKDDSSQSSNSPASFNVHKIDNKFRMKESRKVGKKK